MASVGQLTLEAGCRDAGKGQGITADSHSQRLAGIGLTSVIAGSHSGAERALHRLFNFRPNPRLR